MCVISFVIAYFQIVYGLISIFVVLLILTHSGAQIYSTSIWLIIVVPGFIGVTCISTAILFLRRRTYQTIRWLMLSFMIPGYLAIYRGVSHLKLFGEPSEELARILVAFIGAVVIYISLMSYITSKKKN